MTKLIDKNTTIPASKSQVFSTAADNQPQVDIHVLQGEREMSTDNRTLGRFILDGLPPAPRGVPQVEVSFDIDANGILNVKAVDKATNKEQKITITASSGLSDEEIEKMKKDAKTNAEADKKKREAVDAKNAAETLIFTAEKTLKDGGDKIDSNMKKDVEEKIKTLNSVKDSDKTEEIKTQTEALSKSLQEIGVKMYEQANAEQSKTKPEEDKKNDQSKAKKAEAKADDTAKEKKADK